MGKRYRLGIDIGGTFTDVMVTDQDGSVAAVLKTPSVREAPEKAIFNALEQLAQKGIDAEDIGLFVHGTTLGVNTLIERNGDKTALLVTEGFRDILEIRRLRLENTTDLYGDKTLPLIPRRLVREVGERILADGSVYRPLDERALLDAVAELDAEGVRSIAISFLHSYSHPGHERRAAELIRAAFPHLFVCTGSEIWPQQREYERTLAAVINAYVGRRMRDYFAELQSGAWQKGLRANVLSTMSNGGIVSASRAALEPVRTLLSGPASGVIGATYAASRAGFERVVTFDMGGTSADVSVIDGAPSFSSENKIGDFPVIIPAVDVTAIGAGGGSIAWVDPAGVLKVGPESAGADPGPACYGKGGEAATVTDAYVHLGIIHPDRFLGGTMKLDASLAAASLERLGAKLGLDSYRAAQAVLDVASANMYAQFTPLLAKKGVDPRDFALLAYGGAGPVHVFLLAREVGIDRVLVPPSPGTLCAAGCVVADLRSDFVHTLGREASERLPDELARHFDELEAQGRTWLSEESGQGVKIERSRMIYGADMRYEGQSFDIEVEVPVEEKGDADAIEKRFHERYKQIFGVNQPQAPVAFVNLRATIVGETAKAPELRPSAEPADSESREPSSRTLHFDGREYEARVLSRAELGKAGAAGPLIVEEYDTTVFVPPGFRAYTDEYGNLIGEATS
ncbi:hydantoinase/oxoprolinase family protein [Saccharibacillus sacchari]|uniref:Hydantoinase/oxoprolinase family protein n=1 Tax=Saccharibacillus sacchari TaxID=456493 RepID=A0ACC6PHC7_9BACL